MCVAWLCTDVYVLDTVQWRHLGSYSVPTQLMSPSHDDSHAITRQQGNLRLTHLQCSQYAWSRNQRRVSSSHAADSDTVAERVRISKSRSPQKSTQELWTLFSDTTTCCTFINVFVTKSVIPWYAHPDSQVPWYLCCEPFSTRTHGSKTDVSKPIPLAVARKQFLHSLVPSASPLTFLSSCTGGTLTKSGCPLLIRSPVFDACCASPNCNLCPWLHTDCHKTFTGDCRGMRLNVWEVRVC